MHREVPGGAATLFVEDELDRWWLSVDGEARTFDDPQRRCDDRAREAAAIVVAKLRAPEHPRLAELIERVTVRRPPLVVAPPARFTAMLDAGAVIDIGRGGITSGGGFARIGVAATHGVLVIGAAIGVIGQSPTTVNLQDTTGHLVRVPIDVDARVLARVGRLVLGGDVGLSVTPLHMSIAGYTQTPPAVRADLGVRIAARLHVPITTRLGALLGLEATVVPTPYTVALNRADEGRLPDVWVVASLGIDFTIH